MMNQGRLISIRLGCLATALLLARPGQAQVTFSSNPTNGATGVSVTASVVFTFSGPMNPSFVLAPLFSSTSPAGSYTVNSAWSSGNTVLTCTPTSPTPQFAANATISWVFEAYDTGGNLVYGSGSFTTGSGGGSSGSGTNAITTFLVAKLNYWDQTSAGAPVPDANIPYYFTATTTLASNRTATSITLTLPTSAVSNLTETVAHPEDYYLYSGTTSSNAFETTFPQGVYTFKVYTNSLDQTVQVTLPTTMTQPNPPHITNFVAAQSVNATQAFTLDWDAFMGGTTTDYVWVVIGSTTIWESPNPGTPGALNGTSTNVTIPANSLQANSNYTATIGFYHAIVTSNATYATTAFRATATQFSLDTVGGTAPRPVVTNFVKSGSSFGFNVITTTGQALTVISSTNCALPLAQWPILLSTNSPGTVVHITDPRPATNRAMVYRVRNGS